MSEAPSQVLAHLALDVAGIGHQRVEGAVRAEPLERGFRSHLRHSGHVVHGIAHESEVIHDQLRWHSELPLDSRRIEHRAVHRVDHGHPLVDELGHVLVAGRKRHPHPFRDRVPAQRADDVVRFDARHLQKRQTERLHELVDWRHLRRELFRHGRTIGLVLRVELVPEGLAAGVEDHRHVVRLRLPEQAAQHVADPVERAGRLSLRVAEGRHRVEGPVQVVGPVDEDEVPGRFRVRRIHGAPRSPVPTEPEKEPPKQPPER